MHAKYILKRADIALLATIDGNDAGLILVDRITSTMGYVFYIAVSRAYRRQGIGGALLDRAIGIMEEEGMKDIYAVRDEENMAAERLFGSRLFKGVSLHEFSKNYGFWQSRRLRRRMTMVFGETMMRRVID